MSTSAQLRTVTLAIGFALVALVGPAVPPATAAPEPDTDAGISATCWYEYSFYRVNSTVYASAFKDCVYLDEPQPLSFSVDALIVDWWGSYWVTWEKGSGNIVTSCPTWSMVRHSITRETIMCP